MATLKIASLSATDAGQSPSSFLNNLTGREMAGVTGGYKPDLNVNINVPVVTQVAVATVVQIGSSNIAGIDLSNYIDVKLS